MADAPYRGTVALNVRVPDRHRELVLVSLDAWDHAAVLRGTWEMDPERPFWLPLPRAIATDVAVAHLSRGGGSSSTVWEWGFVPGIPDEARELRVHFGPDHQRPPSRRRAVSADPTIVSELVGWPATVQRVSSTFDGTADPGPWDRGRSAVTEGSVRPVEVLAVSARLDDIGGRDLNVASIATYPAGFMVHIVGSGGLWIPPHDEAVPRRLANLARLWVAEDDRGRRYRGADRGSHSGLTWSVHAIFTPALHPAATTLRLAFPNPFGAGVVTTVVGLRG